MSRIHLPEVLALAGYGRVTLWRRQRAGKMPLPIDRGAQGGIFDRDAVLKALGMNDDAQPETDPWDFTDDAFDTALARQVRRPQKARERQGSGLLPAAGEVSAPRLVASNPAVHRS